MFRSRNNSGPRIGEGVGAAWRTQIRAGRCEAGQVHVTSEVAKPATFTPGRALRSRPSLLPASLVEAGHVRVSSDVRESVTSKLFGRSKAGTSTSRGTLRSRPRLRPVGRCVVGRVCVQRGRCEAGLAGRAEGSGRVGARLSQPGGMEPIPVRVRPACRCATPSPCRSTVSRSSAFRRGSAVGSPGPRRGLRRGWPRLGLRPAPSRCRSATPCAR